LRGAPLFRLAWFGSLARRLAAQQAEAKGVHYERR
jgi:hypothetical protein